MTRRNPTEFNLLMGLRGRCAALRRVVGGLVPTTATNGARRTISLVVQRIFRFLHHMKIITIFIQRPFPGVSQHVVQPPGIGRKRPHRSRDCKTIVAGMNDILGTGWYSKTVCPRHWRARRYSSTHFPNSEWSWSLRGRHIPTHSASVGSRKTGACKGASGKLLVPAWPASCQSLRPR